MVPAKPYKPNRAGNPLPRNFDLTIQSHWTIIGNVERDWCLRAPPNQYGRCFCSTTGLCYSRACKSFETARWQSGYATACKAVDVGSIPSLASRIKPVRPGWRNW